MSDTRFCHHCGRPVGTVERPGRRDACLQCGADFHCCLNCAFHDLHCHNQCREPQAERQVDKRVGNFCDFFSFRIGPPAAPVSSAADAARDRLAGLFVKKK